MVVEVADTTLAFDLRPKVPLYAGCGIAEVWVVDVNGSVIHVLREPREAGYRTSFSAAEGQSVACVVLPEAVIEVRELFPA